MRINGSLSFPSRATSDNAIPDLNNVFVEQVSSLPSFAATEAGRLVYSTVSNQFFYNDGTEWVVLGGVPVDLVNDIGQVPNGAAGTLVIDLNLGRTFVAEIVSNIVDIQIIPPNGADVTAALEFDILFTQGAYGGHTLDLPYNEWFGIGGSINTLEPAVNRQSLMTAKTFGNGNWLYAIQPIEEKFA